MSSSRYIKTDERIEYDSILVIFNQGINRRLLSNSVNIDPV